MLTSLAGRTHSTLRGSPLACCPRAGDARLSFFPAATSSSPACRQCLTIMSGHNRLRVPNSAPFFLWPRRWAPQTPSAVACARSLASPTATRHGQQHVHRRASVPSMQAGTGWGCQEPHRAGGAVPAAWLPCTWPRRCAAHVRIAAASGCSLCTSSAAASSATSSRLACPCAGQRYQGSC